MQSSLDQSFFGRSREDRRFSLKKLRKMLRQSVYKILEFCRQESKKLKKRNEYQSILFPHDYDYEESEEVLQSLRQEYSHCEYAFYLSRCHLFIDNYHLKVIRRATPMPVRFDSLGYGKLRQFASWVSAPQKNILVGVTTLNIVLVISIPDRIFYKYRIQGRRGEPARRIVNVSIHREFFFAFSEQECHICRFQQQRNSRGLEKVVQKAVTEKRISKGQGMQRDGKFYIFLIIEEQLVVQRLELGILLSKIDYRNKVQHDCGSPIVNLEIQPQKTNSSSHVIIAVATNNKVKLLKYSFETEALSELTWRQAPLRLIKHPHPTYLKFIERQNYLLCAIGFQDRLYFVRIEVDFCEFSRRVKFDQRIELVGQLGTSSGLLVVTNQAKDGKHSRKIYVTTEEKLISYSEFVYTQLLEKYEMQFQSTADGQSSPFSIGKAISVYDCREIHIIGEAQIHRLVLSTWEDIYYEMRLTENIKLLKFLILLKHVPSPFLNSPSSFDGLESFFPVNDPEAQQILIEYYHLMDMAPALVPIEENEKLMIPFIIQHRVGNLSDECLQHLFQWAMGQDERLVEELIVGGSDCGWEVAVSRGWIRAFKVMVERGMELQMPVLKLFSMALFQKRTKKSEQSDQLVQQLTAQGEKCLLQMVDYILFILANFFQDLSGNGASLDFRSILLIILEQQMWTFMMKFAAARAVSIISYVFCNETRIKEVNRFAPVDFINFHRKFRGIAPLAAYSNSEAVLSHLSAVFESNSDEDNMDWLRMEHSKLMVLKFQEFMKARPDAQLNFKELLLTYQIMQSEPYFNDEFQNQFARLRDRLKVRCYFKFKKEYMAEILKALVRGQGNNLEKVYRFARSRQFNQRYEQVECEMVDFLAFLWQEIYLMIMMEAFQSRMCDDEKYSLEECDIRVKGAIKVQIKQILSEVEEDNFQYQELSVLILMSINTDNEFTSKIFSKFLAFKNPLVRARLFIWLRLELGRPQPNQPLRDDIIARLKEVIAIDNEESRGLLESFYEGKEKEIIKKIDNDPLLQLEYLELIIQNAAEPLQRYYANLHVQLVLALKPRALIAILDADNDMVEYDLAEALRMTLAAADFQGKNEVLAYLYERQDEIVSCITTHLASFENLLFSYIALCERSQLQQEEESLNLTYVVGVASQHESQRSLLVQGINQKFQEALQLLFRVWQRSYDYVGRYLRKLHSLLTSICSREYRHKQHYKQFMVGYLGALLVTLFERNCLLELSEWLQEERMDLLEFILLMKRHLIAGFEQMYIRIAILQRMAVMEKKILLKEIHEALQKLEYCISSEAFCFVCERPFQEEHSRLEALLFNCGHVYHKGCIEQVNDQDFCFYCVSKHQYQSMIENESLFLVELLKKFKEKRKAKKGEEYIRVERRKDMLISQQKKRANRLALYDKKATALENQAEIIDLKLLIEDYYGQAKK